MFHHLDDTLANLFLSTFLLVGDRVINIICIKAEIPEKLSLIDDELKAIYHSTDTVCFFIFKKRAKRNEFMKRTQGKQKAEREEVYQEYS